MLDNTDTETMSAFRCEFIDFLNVSASHDARVAKRFPAKKTSSCIWNRGNWVEGNRAIEQYRNEETREQGNGEQGNNGTRERGNRGTRGQRNRGAREEGMPMVWT